MYVLIDLQSVKGIFWKQELRQPGTGWSSAKLLGKVATLGERERERETERDEERGKKARLGTAQKNRLLLSAFSA